MCMDKFIVKKPKTDSDTSTGIETASTSVTNNPNSIFFNVCCKILESLIRDHVVNYLLDNNLLSDKQYGFIKGRSTVPQLLHGV